MDEITTMRMDAYYYGFDRTGCQEIDKILSAVAHAGKSFHHTEQWNESARTAEYLTGSTPSDWIQNAASDAAQTIADLRAKLKQVEEERDRYMESALLWKRDVGIVQDELAAKEAELAERNRELDEAIENLKALGQQQMDDYKAHKAELDLAAKVMDNCEETLRHVLNYVEGQGLSAEDDVNESIKAIHLFRDGNIRAIRLANATESVTKEE